MRLALSRTSAGELAGHLDDEAATLELGALLAGVLRAGLKIYLSGELGAGKTTLVRGLLRALGYQGRVKSPTFTLVELYQLSRLDLYHFDFYRFEDPREWIDAGFREAFGTTAVCLVEWPEKAAGQLPAADLRIRLEHADAGRRVQLAADTDEGRQCLERLIG
jgi:tRNA threonylcarbamoyladenosine biosynthesis protein TsaE